MQSGGVRGWAVGHGMIGLPACSDLSPLRQVLRWSRTPLQLLVECAQRYGDAFTLQLANGLPLVIFSDPDVVRQIFVADPGHLHAGEANGALAPLLVPSPYSCLTGAPMQPRAGCFSRPSTASD